jgi:hypothetical protein
MKLDEDQKNLIASLSSPPVADSKVQAKEQTSRVYGFFNIMEGLKNENFNAQRKEFLEKIFYESEDGCLGNKLITTVIDFRNLINGYGLDHEQIELVYNACQLELPGLIKRTADYNFIVECGLLECQKADIFKANIECLVLSKQIAVLKIFGAQCSRSLIEIDEKSYKVPAGVKQIYDLLGINFNSKLEGIKTIAAGKRQPSFFDKLKRKGKTQEFYNNIAKMKV